MWIAKPVQALSDVEIRQWIHACNWRRRQGEEIPLSQTLTWARAAATALDVYVVFNPDENVGGIVLSRFGESGMEFECVNGPLLDWDSNETAPRQVATFSMAVSKLSGSFGGLKLRPRWTKVTAADRERGLPIEAARREFASTLVLDLSEPWLDKIEPRLARTIQTSERDARRVSWTRLEGAELDRFLEAELPQLRAFGESRGFYVPEREWFVALLEESWISEAEGLRFYLSEAEVGPSGAGVEATHLIALHGPEAHYLFGHETRSPEARGAWSAQALAFTQAIAQCAELGARVYDFNGYLDPAEDSSGPDHPYAGVARFKKQFGGAVKEYEIPEFVIE